MQFDIVVFTVYIFLFQTFGAYCSPWNTWKPTAACLLPHLGGILGGFITRKNIKNWYEKVCMFVQLTSIETGFLFFLSLNFQLLF